MKKQRPLPVYIIAATHQIAALVADDREIRGGPNNGWRYVHDEYVLAGLPDDTQIILETSGKRTAKMQHAIERARRQRLTLIEHDLDAVRGIPPFSREAAHISQRYAFSIEEVRKLLVLANGDETMVMLALDVAVAQNARPDVTALMPYEAGR